MTRIINMYRDNPQPRRIRQVAEELDLGGVIVYPTDTVYGIGCDLYNKRGIERIRQIKKLDRRKQMSFICADLKDLSRYAQVSNRAYRSMKRFLPGPYTFVLEASPLVPKIMMTKQRTVGIRIPDCPISLAIVVELGRPIITTSVAFPDGERLGDPYEIAEEFRGRVDLVIDGGVLDTTPSSVISLIDEAPEIIREGKGDVSSFTA